LAGVTEMRPAAEAVPGLPRARGSAIAATNRHTTLLIRRRLLLMNISFPNIVMLIES
jgi:hypothetical protein